MKYVVSLLLVCMTIGCHGSAHAQLASFAAVQRYSPKSPPRSETFVVPGNISVAPEYRVLLQTMLTGSVSFQRQCLRIANERSLAVHLRIVPVRLTGGVRGFSQISRYSGGRTVAQVVIHPFDNHVEIIAHEFEHIIEQLDDVNLAEKARRARSGVHATDRERSVFETKRAVRVGMKVVEEVRETARQGS